MKDFTEVKIPTQLVLLLFVHSVYIVYKMNTYLAGYIWLFVLTFIFRTAELILLEYGVGVIPKNC